MPTTNTAIGYAKEISKTTTRNISFIEAVAEQSFRISVSGLNINTKLNLYVNNNKASANAIVNEGGGDFMTDFKGSTSFIFYYRESLSELNNISEAAYLEYLSRNSGQVTLVLVDSASINSQDLPDNYKQLARCYSETTINKTYAPEVTTNHFVKVLEAPGA
jgi:hypothetical protein